MFGRAMMPTCREVAGDHGADRFEPLPAHVALVDARLQRDPVGARLAVDLPADAVGRIPRHRPHSTIGIGAAVDRVLDHPVESGVTRTPPDHLAVRPLHRKIEAMLVEPEQRLSCAAKSSILSKTNEIAACTRRSGSFSNRSPALTKPTGAATT